MKCDNFGRLLKMLVWFAFCFVDKSVAHALEVPTYVTSTTRGQSLLSLPSSRTRNCFESLFNSPAKKILAKNISEFLEKKYEFLWTG